jgi:lipoate-protein ligase A
MITRHISFNDPADNVLFDDVMLECAEKEMSGEMLRFWESSFDFVVLGRICKVEDDLIAEKIKADTVPVLRRSSGGGTVLQGPGCLNFSLVLKKTRSAELGDINKSYEYILSRVVEALACCGVKAAYYPISDIALIDGQLKFSGNAQCRRRDYFLHHGTVLYDYDLNKIFRYLKMPKSVPEYRRGREHKDFITNIPINPSDFRKALAAVFNSGDEMNIVLPHEEKLLYHKRTNKPEISL